MTQRAQSQDNRVGRPAGPPTKVVRLPVSLADIAQKVAARRLGPAEVNAFLDVHARSAITIPLMTHKAACGFPSPADDYLDRPLDFNELLIQNPAATFAVRIAGDSMIGAGLFPNDIAIVDRSLSVKSRSIVLALLNGEFTIKRYRKKGARVWLEAENPAYEPTTITEDMTFEVWGVIKHSVRMLEAK